MVSFASETSCTTCDNFTVSSSVQRIQARIQAPGREKLEKLCAACGGCAARPAGDRIHASSKYTLPSRKPHARNRPLGHGAWPCAPPVLPPLWLGAFLLPYSLLAIEFQSTSSIRHVGQPSSADRVDIDGMHRRASTISASSSEVASGMAPCRSRSLRITR